MAAIKLENLSYSIDNRVLFRGINAEFYPGEKIAIVGEHGSGRSDLLNLITGMAAPDSGLVYIFDIDINRITLLELDNLRKRIGFIFQNAALISNLKAIENVTLPLRYHTDMSEDEIFERGLHLLRQVGYDEDVWTLPGFLPVFKKKGVALARAMALDPEIMIYDRFLEELDIRQREFIIRLIEKSHASGTKRLSIFTSNDAEEIKGIRFDRILKIKNNLLVEQDG